MKRAPLVRKAAATLTRRLTGSLFAVALTSLPVGPAQATGDAHAARGIVAEHCARCHEVPGFHSRYKPSAVMAPSFRTISNQPDVYTRTRLTAFLRRPHYPMTKFVLSPSDIDNLVAFIESLRED